VQEALVTAQELRADIRGQAQREADGILKEAETEGRRLIAEAEAEARTKLRSSERRLDQLQDSLQEIERRRGRFLKEFRQLLERELDVVQVEEERKPLEERTIDLDLGGKKGSPKAPSVEVPEDEAAELASALQVPLVEDMPPADVPIDELAAAYERSQDADTDAALEVDGEPAAQLRRALDAAPPAPKGQKQDNLMLYLDTDDEV
jgi:hypothetical protein